MNLLEIYKAKKLGRSTESLLASVLGNKPDVSYEWIKESVPYISRNTANGMDVASLCKDKIVGGTIAWNQRVKNPNFNNLDFWTSMRASLSAQDNVLIATALGTGFTTVIGSLETSIPNHKHLTMFDINVSNASKPIRAALSNQSIGNNAVISSKKFDSSDTWYSVSVITVPNKDEIKQVRVGADGLSEGDTIKLRNVNVIDLTEAFGSSIADYIYSLEQATEGAGVAWFKALFSKDWYPFKETELMSVNVSAHVNRDADENIVGNYALDETLSLRGIPKLDANNKLYYDGDTYESDGTVTRKYGVREYQSGDATDGSTMVTDGTNTVYKLDTPITEDADAFSSVQIVDPSGTEEYVVTEQSGVAMPVGHETEYKVLAE